MSTLPPLATQTFRGSSQRELKLVTFRLGRATYGIDVEDVFAIYHALPLVPSPNDSSAVIGYLQLADGTMPAVDMRRQAGLPANKNSSQVDWIIAVRSGSDSIGLIVDEVTEVLSLQPSALNIASASSNGCDLSIQAIVHSGGEAILIPDLMPLLQAARN